MDKQELINILESWEEKYLETIREKFTKLNANDLRQAMRGLDSKYTDQQLAKYSDDMMINSLTRNYPDTLITSVQSLLYFIRKTGSSDNDILALASKFKTSVSKSVINDSTTQINLVLVEELEIYIEALEG